MRDVAQAAGVSQSTVSHVINETRVIAPKTKAAVQRAIAETGYVNDDIARSMRTRSTNTIGVATSAISNIYFAEVVGAIEQSAMSLKRLVMLVDTHDLPDAELAAVQTFVSRRVDGLILAPSAHPEPAFKLVLKRGMPTVLLDRFADVADLPLDMVGVNNVEPTAKLVDLLAAAGHRDIVHIGGRPGLTTTEERLAGYRLGMDRNGLTHPRAVTGQSGQEESRQVVLGLMRGENPPTALIPGNNAMTVGSLQALRDLGLSVPEDVSLACFDDLPWADLFSPGLTVAAQPLADLGRTAMELLHERITHPDSPPQQVRFEPEIRERESIATPRR